MAAASYDQLLRQVEVLKMENSNLRQELQDNSNHLTKLETEASNMKEVLKQLQGTIEEESGETSGSQLELIERLKEMSMDAAGFKSRSRPPLQPSSSSSSASSGSGTPGGAAGGPQSTTPFPRRGLPSAGRDGQDRCLEELEKERSLLLAELEKEEKEKDWYYAQLQNLTKRIDSLPLTENFTLQTDMSRRQLEFEARQIRSAMEEQLGSCQEMERRAQARVSRIQQIEKDILRLGARLEEEGAQGASDSSGLTSAQSSGSRLDQEPANETNYSVPRRITSHLGTKVEMVYSLLSMLGTHDKDDMSRTLLAMSSSQDSCIAMRQSGCLPLLIQLLHGNDKDSLLLGNSRGSKEARARASAALHNIVHSQPDDKRGRREIRVLHLLEQVRHYCEACWSWQENHERGVDQEDNPMPSPVDHQICPAVCVLMKLSFDEEHRHAMNELGGLQAVAELLQVDCEMFGLSSDHYSVTLRRYAGMALTNLTFGDVANKATLCSMKGCMRAMVAQLKSESEDLQQVIASVLRNLSWRADVNSKKTLREVGSVRALMGCALEVQKESTLKSVLSALWNLSAHCTENKADICAVDGALAFLVGTLTHRSHTNTLAIIESGGGILRNVSSLIATNEAHRQILREHGCLPTLLQHLKSHSLTIVSNACGTLWNLSARDAKDQEALWELGAVGMLRNLIHSRHKMIAMGSAAALRNLMANRPARYKDASVVSPGAGAPSLHARKQKALFEELDAQQLSETFDNIDNLSPKAAHRKGRGCNGAVGGGSTTRSYANTPVLSSPKNGDGSKRMGEETSYPRPIFPPSVRASSDSLNSVTSADGYGNRGKTKPSAEPFYSSDESGANKCCVYRKYPADLAHKIRSANHMADDDGAELDTPINYSLKYSDEQLNSGRQSPSHRGGIESDEDDVQDARLRRRNDCNESATSSSRMASAPPPRYVVVSGTSNYSGDSTIEQPIDYSLKYGTDSTNKPLFKSEENTAPTLAPPSSTSTSKLRPAPPANRVVPKSHQESTQTYCVEDTPICFSRGSSLSSLSSEEDEDGDVIGRKRRGGSVVSGVGGNDYPTLPVSEKEGHEEQQQRQQKEAESQTASAPSTRGRRSHHHHGHAHHHHHHHVALSSGNRTPKSPPEQQYAQETPLMFSRCTSVSSLDSFSTSSIASSVRSSEPSGVPSGVVSPSDLPDSPGQTMPPSRAKTPPPQPMQKTEEAAKKKDEEESSADVLLHFATESTPHGFSQASSLSALSLDEPYIAAEMKKKSEEEEERNTDRKVAEAAQPILDESDDDDDIEILEACINMAMPKSSRKPKKQQHAVPRKPSQLPVYKLLPPQSRTQSQQRKDMPPPEEVPRVYCVEGTPLNFSTATSLSDLTIDSPPNEEAVTGIIPVVPPTSTQRRRAGLPEGENGDDILAECISAAMPKAKPRKPIRTTSNSEHLQAPPLPPPLPPSIQTPLSSQQQKKKPTSPVKPMPQRVAHSVTAATTNKAKPGFAFDSPRHYTPIEGTPCCFSRNDSLSSLDFDEDDGGACEKDEQEKKTQEEEGRKRKQQTAAVFPRTKPSTNQIATDEKQKFAIEDTPVCFSRNSSLSSLSDIDQENNNKEFAPPPPEQQEGGNTGTKSPPPAQVESKPRPTAASGYAPKAFHVEDTPVCFSRNSSLSSLSIDSEDDLLQECISSAMPKKKKKAAATAVNTPHPVPRDNDSILAEEEPSEAPRSPASPDSESFDWKAIQEGANSIVSSLNAAAAASPISRQPSSDSDSVLSLKSVGSPFRLLTANNNADEEVEEKEDVKRGAKVLKPGERSTLETIKKKKEEEEEEEEAKALRGGKKVYRSLITGKPRGEPAARGRSKPRAAAIAIAKAPGSGDDRGGTSSRDSTPSRSTAVANQKGGKLSQLPRTASPGSASSSSASRPAKQSMTARNGGGGIPRSESASRVSGSTTKKQKGDPEKPTLVRQSTFIKEAPSPTLKRKLEESAAAAAAATESPSSPDAPLPPTTRRHDINRSHSESPSRPQEVTSSRFSRTGTWKRENGGSAGGGNGGKHSTSLPRVGTWKRTGSSSSVLSASSESSDKGRSEEEGVARSKGTWRKAKSNADSASRSFIEKPEDVWVRLEDCPVNNPRSSSSCSTRSPTTPNAPPIIDSPVPCKIPSSSSSSSSNLNLRRSCESLDDKPLPPERQQPQQQQRGQPRSGAVAARVSPFNYTPSPRKTSTEVTTTTTTTATSTTSSSTTPTRPSLIPTPVTKKREPKGGEGGSSSGGSSGGERGSYIVTSV
ncbi:adenomatous polyposis coli protein [Hippoglossus stenolepis]|uniref:adenomatous polyposis coli protein n=1 Tax=Hippoglossus stenolepis TaxID=195615 RepID=UPI001FAEFB44|nr:adenomatous polyposis coli protein [Hippoglossus stenolepis]XP_035039865.2 adenomatous polyposis coli protein [Hippoglossus stenolepis]XP_035039866.2 adenomatous polyposis coli protein [Hippoglossus stenolepis]